MREGWPPLYAKGRMPAKIAGIRGTFGMIRRPDGRLQVDDVNGWFVVRLR